MSLTKKRIWQINKVIQNCGKDLEELNYLHTETYKEIVKIKAEKEQQQFKWEAKNGRFTNK